MSRPCFYPKLPHFPHCPPLITVMLVLGGTKVLCPVPKSEGSVLIYLPKAMGSGDLVPRCVQAELLSGNSALTSM